VDKADQHYFDAVIRPMLDGPGVEMIGEISDREKPAFLSGAVGLLMPIDWPEPFGLVMIEAMSCGTPVIAFNRGSVPEVIEDGLTGFIVEDEAAAIAAVGCLDRLDRATVRARFEQRFTARRMAEDYLATYSRLAADDRPVVRRRLQIVGSARYRTEPAVSRDEGELTIAGRPPHHRGGWRGKISARLQAIPQITKNTF
jgi:hypothetical protein